MCVKASVCDNVPYRSLSPGEIQQYAFQPVNVMTTYLYPITPESIQSPGGEPNMALFHMSRNWTDISKPPGTARQVCQKPKWIQTCPCCSKSLLLQVRVWSICVSAQCILALIFPVFMLTWRGVNDRVSGRSRGWFRHYWIHKSQILPLVPLEILLALMSLR